MPNQIQPNDPNGTNWYNLGQWLIAWQQASGASIGTDALSQPISSADTEGTKFAKWQRTLKSIQESIV